MGQITATRNLVAIKVVRHAGQKTSFVLFHLKNKPIPRNFTCIQTEVMQINRVESVQYLGMLLDEKLYWHEHVDQICASLVKYFGIFNHIKNFVSKRIARQLYFAFIYYRIQYGIESMEYVRKRH